MTEQKTLELRPMGVGDILDTSLRMYRNRFAVFLIIALVAYVPFGAAQAIVAQAAIEASPEAGPPEIAMGPVVAGVILFFILTFILIPLCQGAMVQQISSSYLGEQIGAAESYRRALPRLVRLLVANILAGIIIFIGFLLLIVPGIIFSLWFMMVTAVVMLESTSATGALGRSKELMSGNLGKGFMIGLAIFVIFVIGNIVVGILKAFIPPSAVIMHVAIDTLLAAALLPIQMAAIILFYYDLRIRKEAFDLEQLSSQLDSDKSIGELGPPAPTVS